MKKIFLYAGQLNLSYEAPNDLPENSYGASLARFNDHMSRFSTGQIINFQEFQERVSDVLEAMEYSNKFARFKEITLYRLKNAIDKEINTLKTQACSKWNECATTFMTSMYNEDFKYNETQWKDFENEIKWQMNQDVVKIIQKFESILKRKDIQDWKLQLESNWDIFRQCKMLQFVAIVQNAWHVKFSVAPEVANLEKNLIMELEKIRKGLNKEDSSTLDEERMNKIFQRQWDKILDEARNMEARNMETHLSVEQSINDIYTQQERMRELDISDRLELQKKVRKWKYEISQLELKSNNSEALFTDDIFTYLENELKELASKVFHPRDFSINRGLLYVALNLSDVINLMRNETKFNLSIVSSIINKTKEKMKTAKMKRENLRLLTHRYVQQVAAIILQHQNRAWQEKNSIVAALKQKEVILRGDFFLKVKGVEGEVAAKFELITVLKQLVRNSLHTVIITQTADLIKQERWFQDADIMRAQIDLYLCKKWKLDKRDVIDSINNNQYFKSVLNELIKQHVSSEDAWNYLINRVSMGLEQAGIRYSIIADKSHSSLWIDVMDSFAIKLGTEIKQFWVKLKSSFIQKLSVHLKNASHNTGSIFNEVKEEIKEKWSLTSIMSDYKVDITRIRQDILAISGTGVKYQCGEPCPRCGALCTLKVNHPQKCHDTCHQPSGLAGIRWVGTNKLVSLNCAQSVHNGYNMAGLGPYADFEKIYPGWSLPITKPGEQSQVKQFIFFNAQEELCKKFPGCKPADDIPVAWNRQLRDIEFHLKQKLALL